MALRALTALELLFQTPAAYSDFKPGKKSIPCFRPSSRRISHQNGQNLHELVKLTFGECFLPLGKLQTTRNPQFSSVSGLGTNTEH